MPLFRRPDADLVRDVAPVRAIMPYLMRGKAESVVLHDATYEIERTRAWLKAYNRSHPERATLFTLWVYACARALHERPSLNRFVSGGRLWQRRGVSVAFAVKTSMEDGAPLSTVKVAVPREEPFPAFARRIVAEVERARAGDRPIDREVRLFVRLPGLVLRVAVALVRALDAWNLLPAFFMRDDPMFSSLFVANLGSAGVSDAYHHLYEYGTTAIFGTFSVPGRVAVAGPRGVEAREAVRARFTFDERIEDGFYAARSLAVAQRIFEDPARHLGPPEGPASAGSP